MNRRQIKKVLARKHEAFCESITDKAVRKLVEKNSIITGGSIVSLLLGEKITDFDYYFLNQETALAVANYYVKLFNKLNPKHNIKPEVIEDGERVRIEIQSAGITSENEDTDYAYFESQPDEQGEDYVEKMIEAISDVTVKEEPSDDERPMYRPIFLSDNAVTLSNKVQLIIRFHGAAEEIHKNYDFIHCTCYWTAKEGKLVLPPAALESILVRQLQYFGSLYPVCSVIRTRKFIKRGWHINAGQFLKMCFQISELDLSDIDVLQEQLTGVDAAYFWQVIEYCRKKIEEMPDFKITMPYLVKIIDKIF